MLARVCQSTQRNRSQDDDIRVIILYHQKFPSYGPTSLHCENALRRQQRGIVMMSAVAAATAAVVVAAAVAVVSEVQLLLLLLLISVQRMFTTAALHRRTFVVLTESQDPPQCLSDVVYARL
jgi:hypothetical protein